MVRYTNSQLQSRYSQLTLEQEKRSIESMMVKRNLNHIVERNDTSPNSLFN